MSSEDVLLVSINYRRLSETGIDIQDKNGAFRMEYMRTYRNGVCEFWLNEVEASVVSNLCTEAIAVPDAVKVEDDELETYQIVLIAIAGLAVLVALCWVVRKWCCASKKSGVF